MKCEITNRQLRIKHDFMREWAADEHKILLAVKHPPYLKLRDPSSFHTGYSEGLPPIDMGHVAS